MTAVQSGAGRAPVMNRSSRKGPLYGHPNDDFIISMILIDAAKENQ